MSRPMWGRVLLPHQKGALKTSGLNIIAADNLLAAAQKAVQAAKA